MTQIVGPVAALRTDLGLLNRLIEPPAPWRVEGYSIKPSGGLTVYIGIPDGALKCPYAGCKEAITRHGRAIRNLWHFPAFGKPCRIVVRQPRVCCPMHDCPTISVPATWAEAGYTTAFAETGRAQLSAAFHSPPKRRKSRAKAKADA